ncbi:SDR family NAD(P)-dependent oxidoreductase [Actinocrinis puniceicyclus]|uniref:SDR family NAD(P)-dependent oxidoreductase n=1 Tax=Actinocrinis puniceicyclus TaxID=977794 RepID=A0A8J7WIN3_9ACTN|nr:type I polyketide synthase [Actinocrinis puniceicyclus]MBS2962968.1 SDR family NAD(P)-dependent oxidoreductase [Actinocrinis puniceicyclus]
MTDVSDATAIPSHVAITGMAGRFPEAPDIAAFWENLRNGREAVSFLTEAQLLESGVDPRQLAREDYVKAKGVLRDADLFDARFFGYSPREAQMLDPQHRLFLECVWEALESAGCDPAAFDGRIGVFAGSSLNSYLLFNVMASRRDVASHGEYQTLLANDKDFLATRASYKLGLTGPAMTVQTACSTSLTAVHLACQSLLNGECDIALAGGVSVSVPLRGGYVYEQGGILSRDGRCRAFDAEADGTVAGNGIGVVVLRRLADALEHGDRVEAVIRGTAINNDGALKAGYTAPSVAGQAEVITEALAVAEVDPRTIGYVEAHGTATPLGDPIEIAALTRAFREHTDATGFCAIGSVKSSVGHLDAAAGVTSLIKTVLALKHRVIPASLHFHSANPRLDLENSPFFVSSELRAWPGDRAPRRAGVSSFGIGGTNVHVVLEEAPDQARAAHCRRPAQLLALSGRTAAALADNARRLADHLEQNPDTDLAELSFTLGRRRAFEQRGAVVCSDPKAAVRALRAVGPDQAVRAAEQPAPVALLFPGQGAQYAGMARDLYEHEPAFNSAFDACADLLAPHLGEDLRTLLFARVERDAEEAARELQQTSVTQPALFAVEYALAQLWREWGVAPRAMAGHSIGEFAAACLSGVFSLADAARLVAVRGRILQEAPPGGMLAVFLPQEQCEAWLTGELCLAAVNSSALTAVSGPLPAIEELQRRMTAAGITTRALRTSHAFHSASVQQAVEPFTAEVRKVDLNPPAVPFCSNLTGTWITDEQATDPGYWGAQLRATVRFRDCLGELLADPDLVLLECGPGNTLGGFARGHDGWREHRTLAGSLRHPKEKRDDREHMLTALASLWNAGVPVDLSALHAGEQHRVLPLPAYAFQRQRYWLQPDPAPGHEEGRPAEAAVPMEDWFYTPGWRRLPPLGEPAPDAAPAVWVLLGDDLPLSSALASRLQDDGAGVVLVLAGEPGAQDDGRRRVDPADREHVAALFESVRAERPAAVRVVHLWSLGDAPDGQLDAERIAASRRFGFDSLLALAQGIASAGLECPVSIDVLCEGVHAVTGGERLRPENCLLLGASTVIPQEITGVACRTLDVTGLDPRDPADDAVSRVHAVLRRTTQQRDLALRGRHWWTREFDAARIGPAPAGPARSEPALSEPALSEPAPSKPGLSKLAAGGAGRLRDSGVYLVTGGLGGVGLALARQIARSVDGPALGLLHRSPFPAEAHWSAWLEDHGAHERTSRVIGQLRALQDSGARVLLLQADVTDAGQTGRAVELLRERFRRLDGVIHAAGVASRGLIEGKTRQDADAVLAPKTQGTLVLDGACRFEDLDFVLLCSSLTSVLGGPGQSDYCAANAFLDGFAQWKRQTTGAAVSSVAWDTWRGVGMAAGLAARLGGGAQPTGQPLLHQLVRATDTARTYATTLTTAESWIVDEHRIMGHGLVPGTAYLELVRAAVADQAAGRAIELRDVVFSMPLIVPDGQSRRLFTTVESHEDRVRFTVQSPAPGAPGSWLEHAGGWVSFPERTPETPRDLDEVLRECAVTEVLEDEEDIKHRFKLDLVEKGGRIEFAFGPRWRCLRRIQAGERRLLVTLELDAQFAGDLDAYPLHPALLDVAGASARLHAEDIYYLPLTYRSLRIMGALTRTVHCRVELKEPANGSGEMLTCDIDMLDPHGRPLVRVEGFSIKRINDIDALLDQIDQAVAPTGPAAHEDDAAHEDQAAPGALALLAEGISEQDALAVFSRLLAAPQLPEQIVVAHRDLAGLRRLAGSLNPQSLAREAGSLAPAPGRHPRPALETPYTAPATEQECALAAIWQEVLGVEQVGVDDDFFELGGHSLAAVQIGSRIQARFGTALDLSRFFERPTVAAAAALLAASQTAATHESIRPVRRDESDAAQPDIDDLSDDEVESMLRDLLVAEGDRPDDDREGSPA